MILSLDWVFRGPELEPPDPPLEEMLRVCLGTAALAAVDFDELPPFPLSSESELPKGIFATWPFLLKMVGLSRFPAGS